MNTKFKCSECGTDIVAKDKMTGDIVPCGTCGSLERIPSYDKFVDDNSFDDNFNTEYSTMLGHLQYNFKSEPKPSSATGLDLIKGVAIIWVFDLIFYGIFRTLNKLNILDKVDSTIYLYFFDAIFTVSVIWLFTCYKFKKPLFDGFGIYPVSFSIILICAIVGFVFAAFNVYIGDILRQFFPIKDIPLTQFTSKPKGLLNFLFIGMTYGPIFEEVYYRGFLFPILQKEIGSFRAILYVSLWFGLIHGYQLGGHFSLILPIIIIGFVLTYLRYKTSSLIPSMVAHISYNISVFIVTLVMSVIKFSKIIN
jgi:uncharacterized protein